MPAVQAHFAQRGRSVAKRTFEASLVSHNTSALRLAFAGSGHSVTHERSFKVAAVYRDYADNPDET